MNTFKYDNPTDAYKEAQLRINSAKGGFLKFAAIELDLSGLGLTAIPLIG